MGCFLVLAEVSRFYFFTNITLVFVFEGTAFAIVQLVSGKRENRSGILARDRSISDTYNWSKQRRSLYTRGLFGWVRCLQVLRFTYLLTYSFIIQLR